MTHMNVGGGRKYLAPHLSKVEEGEEKCPRIANLPPFPQPLNQLVDSRPWQANSYFSSSASPLPSALAHISLFSVFWTRRFINRPELH